MVSNKKRMGKFFYEKDEESGEEFVVYPSIPIFDEHEGEDGTVYDREVLAHIAQNNNDRIEDTDDLCPIVGWHTPQEDDYDPDKDPPIIGWAENFRVEDFGNKRPRGCIFCTFKIYKKFHDYFKSHPRRSVEIWPEDDPKQRYIDPIAVLAGVTPKRDLGYLYSKSTSEGPEVLEPMRYSQKNQSSKLKYEMAYPGGGNTYIPGGTDRKKNSRSDAISVQYEQSFSELDRQLQADLFGYEGTHGQGGFKPPGAGASFMSGMASSLISGMGKDEEGSKEPAKEMEVPEADVSGGVKAPPTPEEAAAEKAKTPPPPPTQGGMDMDALAETSLPMEVEETGVQQNEKQASDSGFKYAEDGNSVTSNQEMGEPTMALSDQEMGQIVQGVETLVQDLLQQQLPGLIQKAMGEPMPEDTLAEDEAVAESEDAEEGVLDEVIMGDDAEEMPEQNAKKSKDDEDEDEKEKNGKMYEKDSEDYGKDSEDKEMYGGGCGKENYEEDMKMAKMMFAKACNSYKLDSDSADIEGAKQYMASLDDSDKESISRYVGSTESSDQEKQLYSKVSVKTESSEQYSKAKREAKAYYQKKLQQETLKYQKVQQANRKLMDEIVSMKSDLAESRKKERYSKISSRLADLEKDGYCFDREKEVSFCMNLTDDQVNEHISERIPMHYAKAPFGDMIPVVESERITPAPSKSEKYAKAASDATITLRDGGLRGLKYKKVLDWMCENDTDRTPSADELGY